MESKASADYENPNNALLSLNYNVMTEIAGFLDPQDITSMLYTCHFAERILEKFVLYTDRRVLVKKGMSESMDRFGLRLGKNVSFHLNRNKSIRGMCFPTSGKLVVGESSQDSFNRSSILSVFDPRDWPMPVRRDIQIESGISIIGCYGMCPIGDKIALIVDDHDNMKDKIQIWDVNSMEMTKEMILVGGNDDDSCYSLCEDSHGMLVLGFGEGSIKVWNPVTGLLIRVMPERHNDAVDSLALDHNGLVVSGSEDGMIKVWDTLNGVCEATLNGLNTPIFCICSLIGGGFATGHYDGKIMRWTLPATDVSVSIECSKILEGHTKLVRALCQLPDGRLVSGSLDTQIRVWGIDAGICIRVIRVHLYPVINLAVHPDGVSIVSCSGDPFGGKCIHVTALDDKHALPEDDDDLTLHNRALDVDPKDYKMFEKCAKYLSRRNDHHGVIELCRRVLKKNLTRSNIKLWHLLGEALSNTDDHEGAIQVYLQILEEDPDNAEALKVCNDSMRKLGMNMIQEIKELKQANRSLTRDMREQEQANQRFREEVMATIAALSRSKDQRM